MSVTSRRTVFDPVQPLAATTVLLEASAGTGKTYNIANLFLRLLVEKRVPVESILVVTFTEAATAELRDRIRARIRHALDRLRRMAVDGASSDEDDDEVIAHLAARARAGGGFEPTLRVLREALEGFDEAAITTIHGFCRRMLQQNAFESGVDFEAELVADARPLVEEVVQDFWLSTLHGAPAHVVRHLVDGQRLAPDRLVGLALLATSDPEMPVVPPATPAAWPDDTSWRRQLDLAASIWCEDGDEAVRLLEETIDPPDGGGGALRRNSYTAEKTATNAAQVGPWLERLRELRVADRLPGAVAYFTASRLAAATKKGQTTPKHAVFDALDRLSDEAEVIFAALQETRTAFEHQLIEYVRAEVRRRRAARHEQSFDDLLRLLRDGLLDTDTGPRLAQAIRKRYQAALIDEFQDTDPVQWAIFRRAFADADVPLYLIGDPKQAIYGFRGADLYTYMAASATAGEATYDLVTNWRSDGPFVSAVNHLFARPAVRSPFLEEGIRYVPVSAAAQHQTPRLHIGGAPVPALELCFIRRATAGVEDSKVIRKGWGHEDLPAVVAADIARFLARKPELAAADDADARLVRPGDLAVLVRTNRQARAMQVALRAQGIPSVLHGADSVLASDDAGELQRVLDAVAEPTNQRLVRSALATDLAGVSGLQMAEMEADEGGWEAWLALVREWHDVWRGQGFIQMFRRVLVDLDVPNRMLGWDDGERRLTNLLHLAEILQAEVRREGLEPAAVTRWLRRERQDPRTDETERQLRLESDANAVEIVTVHRSKGLQYRVVWCPFLWDGALLRDDEKAYLRFHDPDRSYRATLDIGPDAKAEPKASHITQASHERRAEALRLLYVALTRARHHAVVYWGAFWDGDKAPLAHVLHPSHGGGKLGSDDELLEDLRELAASSDGSVTVTFADGSPGPVYVPPATSLEPLRARGYDRSAPLDTWWRRGSFSGMVRGAWAPNEAAAWDEPAAPEEEAPAAPPAPALPLADFPRGRKPGSCLHEILEHLDFTATDAEHVDAAVAAGLRRWGLSVERWREPVREGLRAALETPLDVAGTTRLAEVARGDRLDELSFHLPVWEGDGVPATTGGVVGRDLAELFADHASDVVPAEYAARLAELSFAPLRGFLTGAIDLIFRRPGGLWFVVDYKSNHLGDRLDDYELPQLVEAMNDHHYVLQYHLYLVALHRYLGARLADYDYDRHIGGAYYLFLRGMQPSAGAQRGVYFDRPPRALVEGLSALFESSKGGAP